MTAANSDGATVSDSVDVWGGNFAAICEVHGLALRRYSARDAEGSEAAAALFIIDVYRRSRWLRWRFPRALAEGSGGAFERWLVRRGHRKFALSAVALKKIRGVFRRPSGSRIYDIYLQDRELQRAFPLGLVPAGQRHFLGWLTTFGRDEQGVRDDEVLWFLHESAQQVSRGIALSYLVNPEWQARFPAALAEQWRSFSEWLRRQYSALRCPRVPDNPPKFSPPDSSAARGANILSHFCYPSGIQQAALWTKAALERAGLPTSCRDVPAGINTTLAPRIDWLGTEVHPVTLITVAPTPHFAMAYERSGLHRRDGVYRIAYWAWELETVPEQWVELQPLLEEIWAPTEFVARAMQSRFTVPVWEMLPGVEVPEIEPVSKKSLGVPDDQFVFLFTFDMYSDIERKNPFAVIRAFRHAFRPGENATLVIKTGRGAPDAASFEALQHFAAKEDVQLINESFSRAKAYGLLDMCDCYVSLHRSEGFGLGMAEAMLLAKPVIATGYSGNMSFMTRENSLLVDYHLVDTSRAGPLYRGQGVWAEPSEQHAAQLMRQVFEEREAAAALGARAQAEARVSLSLTAAGERMATRLREIAAAREA